MLVLYVTLYVDLRHSTLTLYVKLLVVYVAAYVVLVDVEEHKSYVQCHPVPEPLGSDKTVYPNRTVHPNHFFLIFL